MKKERNVIHLELNNNHFYFGSLAAIYTVFPKDEIGINYSSLKNYGISSKKIYSNSKCTIRKGILITIKKG